MQRVILSVPSVQVSQPDSAVYMAPSILESNANVQNFICLQGELSGEIHKVGIVESEEFLPDGSRIAARVPVPLAMRLAHCAVGPKTPQQIAV